MKTYFYLASGLLILLLLVGQRQKDTNAKAQNAGTTAFVNVNVIPMDTERVLENQTVIVEGERITAIGPVDEVAVPAGAEIIDGQGAYLMPGLADMHGHFHFDDDPNSLRLYPAYGVTSVRNLNAIPEHLEWREQVANGELFGPTFTTSGNSIYGVPSFLKTQVTIFRVIVVLSPVIVGLVLWLFLWLASKLFGIVPEFGQIRRFIFPSLAGLLVVGGLLAWFKVIPLTSFIHLSFPFASVPESEAEAREMVRDQKAAGVDFIKPYNWMKKDVYFAVMDEAEKLGIYTAGHTIGYPEKIALRDILDAGQDEVVHADEFTIYFWVGYDPAVDAWVEYDMDMDKIDEVAALVAEYDVVVTPTLITNETVLLGLEDMEDLLGQPAYQVIRPELMEEWRTSGRLVNWQGQEGYRREQWRPLLMELTKALQDHGVLLNLGTDVSVEGIVPGYSAHLELPLMVEAGLTNFEALAAGTRNPALTTARMGADGDWGTVVVGNRADLILMPNNPLEDVTHTQNRIGVMLRGQWYTQAELDALVAEFVATYQNNN